MPVTGSDDESLPIRELARRVGIAESTLRSWEHYRAPALAVQRPNPRTVRVIIRDLRAFCAAHPQLRKTATVLDRLDHPVTELDLPALRAVLGAVIAALRTATAAHLQLVESTTDQAQNTVVICRGHAAALAGAIAALDDALARVAGSSSSRG